MLLRAGRILECLFRAGVGVLFVGLAGADLSAAPQTGAVVAWGGGYYDQTNVPAGLNRAIAIAAGFDHCLAVRSDGTVVGWGNTNYGRAAPPTGLSGVTAVAVGAQHCLALKSDGTVVAWGDNSFGQTNLPFGLSGVRAIAAGYYHSLALRNDGRVVAWGRNDFGQASVPATLSGAVAVAAGDYHSLALRSDGYVWGWGENFDGQASARGPGVVGISAGERFSLGLYNTSVPFGWGNNGQGRASPPPMSGVAAVSAGTAHGLALLANRTIVAWGDNFWTQSTVPDGLSNVLAVAGGGTFSLALQAAWPVITTQPQSQSVPVGSTVTFAVGADGSPPLAYQWRKNGTNILAATNAACTLYNVQLADTGSYSVTVSNGVGSVTSSNAILTVNTPPTITRQPQSQDVAAGSNVTFSVAATGSPVLRYQWRRNGTNLAAFATNYTIINAQPAASGNYTVVVWNDFGTATSAVAVLTVHPLPSILAPPQNQTVLAGASVTFSVTASNATAYQWQKNGANLGGATQPAYTINNAQTNDSGSYRVVVSNPWGSVTSSAATLTVHPPATNASPVVIGWGESEVWNGSAYVDISPPSGLSNIVAIAAGLQHGLALTSDGAVIGWGDNAYGQAGPPANATNVVAVAAGAYHSLALREDGSVVAWGRSDFGQATVPTTLRGVLAIAAGGFHSLALTNGGRVLGWGKNAAGQATAPSAATNVSALAAGWEHSLGVRSNGTVAGWGTNFYGQANPPPGLSNVVAVAAGLNHSLALRRDGTVAAWGDSYFGQTNVPAGLAGVKGIACGSYHCLALRSNGTVVCWGHNNSGQTDPPEGLNSVLAVSGAGAHSLALRLRALRLQPPQLQAGRRWLLVVTAEDGGAIEAYRAPRVEVRATTNLVQTGADWIKLTNALSYVNGTLRLEDTQTNLPRRFYITVENP